MKKQLRLIVSMLLTSILIVSLFPGAAWAEEVSGENTTELVSGDQLPADDGQLQASEVLGDYKYLLEDGKATITGYTGAGGDVIVPETLGGYPVTSIAKIAFQNRKLTSVIIPESVTYIGEFAFNWCMQLTSIIIPKNVACIDNGAFDSSGLKIIQFNSSTTTIISGRYFNTETIPRSATIIGYDPSTAKAYAEKYGNDFQLSKNIELRFGNKLGLTIPSDVPILGGMKADFKIEDIPNIVFSASEDTKGKTKIGIGVKDLKEEDWTKFKKSVTDTKNANNIQKELGDLGSISKTGTSFFEDFETDADIVGYIEGYDKEGEFIVESGSLVLNLETAYSRQWQVPASLPVVVEAGGGVETELLTKIAEGIFESGEINLEANLTITPSLELGGGLGLANTASIVAIGKLKLPWETNYAEDTTKLSAVASAKIKVTVMCFDYTPYDTPEKTWQIYPSTGGDGVNSWSINHGENNNVLSNNIYNINQYSLMARDYRETPSFWTGGNGISTESVDYTNQTLKLLQTNIYPDAHPKITEVGGKAVMLWLADNPGRSDANRTMLVYSVCDPNTGVWSTPVAVSDDGTADFYPQIGCDGTSLYVTWQNSKTTFADDVTLTDAAKAGEIAVAKFDVSAGTFTGVTTLTDNNILDTQPQMAVSGDKVGVIWTGNDQNDIFGSTGKNSLFAAELNSSTWSAPQTLLSDQNAINSISAGYINSILTAAYTPDEDNDLNTVIDRDLYTLSVGQSAIRMTSDDVLDSNPVFAGFNGTDSLFWYHDGNINYVPTSNLKGIPAAIFDEQKEGFSDSFTIVNNATGKTAAIWTKTKNEQTEIYGSLYDNGQWNNDIRISDVGNRILYPSGIFDNDGNFNIAFNRQTVSDDKSEQNDLCTLEVIPSYNLTMSDPYFDDADIIPNTAMPVEIDVTNNGALAVDQIKVEVLDGSATNNTQTISENIRPGETKTITVRVNLPETISRKDFSISVTPVSGEEYDLSDNQKTISIGYTDLSLSLEKYNLGEEGGISVKAQVGNLSYIPANATIKFTEDTADGNALFTQTLIDVKQSENQFIAFDIDPATLNFDSDVKVIYVSVTADGEETSTGDNSDFIIFRNPAANENPDNPGQPGFVAFLGKDPNGTYYEYSAADLNNAYLAYQINPALSSAKMYQQFLTSQCKVVALKDGAKGYMDYNAAATASLMAQMKGEAFDINAYLAGAAAKQLEETVGIVKIVDKEGNVPE